MSVNELSSSEEENKKGKTNLQKKMKKNKNLNLFYNAKKLHIYSPAMP